MFGLAGSVRLCHLGFSIVLGKSIYVKRPQLEMSRADPLDENQRPAVRVLKDRIGWSKADQNQTLFHSAVFLMADKNTDCWLF